MLTLTIFTQNHWDGEPTYKLELKGYDKFFCGTESIFGDILNFLQKLASFMVLCTFLIGKNADVDNFYSKSLRWRANLLIGIERLWPLLLWNRKHIQGYNMFSSEIGLLYGTLCIFGRQKCWRWQFFLKITVMESQLINWNGKVMTSSFVEQKVYSGI